MDWVGISLYGYEKEAARKFNKPGDLQSILKTIGVTQEQFEETKKEVIKKDPSGLKITAQTSGAPELYDPIIILKIFTKFSKQKHNLLIIFSSLNGNRD